MNNEMPPLKNETVPTSFLQKTVTDLTALEDLRLLQQEAEKRINRIIAEVWCEEGLVCN